MMLKKFLKLKVLIQDFKNSLEIIFSLYRNGIGFIILIFYLKFLLQCLMTILKDTSGPINLIKTILKRYTQFVHMVYLVGMQLQE
jgi:hypothetical protein